MYRFPELFGPDKYFCVFGSLHIEKSILVMCGQIIKGSGLDQLMSSCGLSILGTQSLVTVNDIKRARYCLQIGACVIYKLLSKTHQESGDNTALDAWLEIRANNSEMALYWKIILEIMVDALVFIRSIREGRFLLYQATLRKLVKWYFALDHYNYARWISVQLYDFLVLPQYSPELYESFLQGYFTFQRTSKQFSLMGLDQIHEQNNAVIKGTGGAIPYLNREDESALARWSLCLHELTSIISEYEGDEEMDFNNIEASHHHEDTATFKTRYSKDVCRLEEAIITNPFKLEKLTVLNQETASFNASVFEDIESMSKKGEQQFLDFCDRRLIKSTISIKDPITLNSFNLPGNQSKRAAKDPIMTKKMMDKLIEAAQQRRENVENTLNTEVFWNNSKFGKGPV